MRELPSDTASSFHKPENYLEDKPAESSFPLWDWIKSIALAMIVVLCIHHFIFNFSIVSGHSMEPTFQGGERLFVNKIRYIIGAPDHGDIVILRDPEPTEPDKQYLVKRVIGVPGDHIEVRNHEVLLNGEELSESYTDVAVEGGDLFAQTVPSGHYFVMGDNRHLNSSKDSRYFGMVPIELIEGRADYIIWPITRMKSL